MTLGLAGCKKGAGIHVTEAPPAQLPSGWSTAQSSDKTVTIGVPGGWRYGIDTTMSTMPGMAADMGQPSGNSQLPNDSSGLGAQIQQMEHNMSEQSKKEEKEGLAKLEEKGIILNVINGSKPIPGEQRTRFYVKRVHDSGVNSLEAAAEAEQKHYGAPDKPTPVKLPIGHAFRIAKDDNLRDGMTMHQISYIVVDDADVYLLRFETEEDAQSIQSVAEAVAQTLRIVPAKRE